LSNAKPTELLKRGKMMGFAELNPSYHYSLGGTMKRLNSTLLSTIIRCMLPLAGLIVPQAVQGATWQATAGAQSVDMGRQALAFLPNELWIHAGDSITWTRAPNETHTVSFLTADQLLPAGPHSNDVITPDGSPFDGSSYVNSGQLKLGQTYTVKFPTAGNFKLVCLVHLYMNGTVHVLEPSARLPHDQAFYDREATDQGSQLLSEIDQRDDKDHRDDKKASRGVIAGTGEIVATGGGFQSAALFRFFPETTKVHVGQTVEWTNIDPAATPHTITFGVEPANLRFAFPIVSSGVGVNQSLDSDGAVHATVGSPTDNVHSGYLFALPADRFTSGNADLLPTNPPVLSQFPLPVVVNDVNPRFRVTFTHAGTFNYYCALHEGLGMLGQVIVVP
jgi:plastocyanin